MAQAIAPPVRVSSGEILSEPPRTPRKPPAEFRFHNLVLSRPTSLWRGRSTTLALSILLHAALLAVVVIVPILTYNFLPAPGETMRAFFVAPPEVAPPPPPPPPPPPAAMRAPTKAPVAPRPVEPAAFVAPVEVPSVVVPETHIDLGVEGGVPGGVEGGVPGGVIGGIVGGLPSEAPPPPANVVRIGGQLVAPKLLHRVDPQYPDLAAQARLQGLIILEAWVGMDGRVKSVKLLRGAPLFDEPAVAAVQQWRYKPLLLNGQPTEFILTVTLVFKLEGGRS
jgi:periplasmic protein TonB